MKALLPLSFALLFGISAVVGCGGGPPAASMSPEEVKNQTDDPSKMPGMATMPKGQPTMTPPGSGTGTTTPPATP